MQEVIDALVAGAAAGGKDAATLAVKDAYMALRTLVTRRFDGSEDAETALAKIETQAARRQGEEAVTSGWRTLLGEELDQVGADADVELLKAARQLLAVLQEAGARSGVSADRNLIDARYSQGAITGGSHTNITQNFAGRAPIDPSELS